MKLGNLMIVQGGGPTAVFNATLSSVIAEAIESSPSSKVYGALSGAHGLAQGDFVNLGGLTTDELQILRHSPGAALGSSRFRPEEEDLQRQTENLRKLGITSMLFIGGNGTMRGAELSSAFCRQAGLEVQVIGIPKTVDNDIAVTDRCPGYASAARYVAQSTRELGLDIRSLPQPVTILETMGRSVGWLAAAATLGKAGSDSAPQLVYVPEVPFDKQSFLADLDDIVSMQGWAVVVVAEGIRNKDGSLVYQITDSAQQDSLKRPITGGVSQYLAGLVAADLKIRCRSEKPGLLGRSSMAHVSAQDYHDAVTVGRAAVRAVIDGAHDQMIALRPLQDSGEHGYDLVPLSAVAGIERPLPSRWLTHGRLAIAEEFRDYIQPLVGELNQHFPGFSAHLSPFGAC